MEYKDIAIEKPRLDPLLAGTEIALMIHYRYAVNQLMNCLTNCPSVGSQVKRQLHWSLAGHKQVRLLVKLFHSCHCHYGYIMLHNNCFIRRTMKICSHMSTLTDCILFQFTGSNQS